VARAIGVALVEVVNQRFETGTEPFGAKWQKLNPAYAAIKTGPGILRASLMLQRSVTFQTSGLQITVGSNRIYAGVHQFGATIKPVNAKALAFRLGVTGAKGGTKAGIVRVKSVTIPARPYLGFGPNDQRAVLQTIGIFVGRTFSG
jgi:phage gpG-like protein